MIYSSLVVEKKMHCVWASFAYLNMEECEQSPDNIIFIQPNIKYNEENASYAGCLYMLTYPSFKSIWNTDIYSYITRRIKFECTVKQERYFKWAFETKLGKSSAGHSHYVTGYFARWPLRWRPGRHRVEFGLIVMGDGVMTSWKRLSYNHTVIRAGHKACHKAIWEMSPAHVRHP